MRNICIAAIAAGLILSPAAWADPLAPGKPAGVHKAQDWDDSGTILIIIGVGAAAAAIALAASSSNSSGPAAITTSPAVSTGTAA